MNQQFMIPANTKKGELIFNIFRGVDLILFFTGAVISMIFLFAFKGNTVVEMVIKLAPVSITGLLVMPVPNYHNVLVFLTEMIKFYNNRRVYIWKGWCANNGEEAGSK